MKSKLCLALFGMLAVAPLASADTELRLTGSTAFRAAVHAALLNSTFTSAPAYAHSNASGAVSGASKSIWRGSVSGISGTTTIRCTWSGSAQGISDVTAGANVSFLTTANLILPGENFSKTASENLTANAAFSDVGQSSTVFDTPTLDDVKVGVVVFTYAVNDTSATGGTVAARYGFDNITAQFARALYTTGSQKKSMLTGNSADTRRIYAIGRDKGSGTRITALVETKYGAFTPLTHFAITAASDAVTELQVWPTTGTGSDALAGNGGYTSGGTLSGLMVNKSDAAFTLKNAAGTVLGAVNGQPNAHLVSCVGIADSVTIVNGGGARLKYEGISYDSAADDGKVQEGVYTLWGYQHLLASTLDADQAATVEALKTGISTNLTGVGIAEGAMNVSRQEDGGVVAP